jgi:hypothetical protein
MSNKEKVNGVIADAIFTLGRIEEQKANIIDTVRYIRQNADKLGVETEVTETIRSNFEFVSTWFVKVGNQLGDVSNYIKKEICDVEEAALISESEKDEKETVELTKLD